MERFHQTLKKFLAKQPPPVTKKQLQRQLDAFVNYYNDVRPLVLDPTIDYQPMP